jgi:hypothetical protein
MSMYTFIHNLLDVLVQIANKVGFKGKKNKKNWFQVPRAFSIMQYTSIHFPFDERVTNMKGMYRRKEVGYKVK